MAALAGNASFKKAITAKKDLQIVNAAVMYAGAFVAGVGPGHGTAAKRGRVEPWSAADFQIPVGHWIDQQKTGDTAASPVTSGGVSLEPMIVEATVTGAASVADVFKPVYLSTDNLNDLTLTRPATNLAPVGVVLEYLSGTTCRIFLYGFEGRNAIAMGGQATETWHLGCITPFHTAAATVDLLTGIEAPYHGKFIKVYGIVARKATDADVDVDVNLEIEGVDVTGGVIEWLFSDAAATKKAGTAITGANEFHKGDLIDVEGVFNAAGTATDVGLMDLYAEVERLIGV